MAVMNYRDPFVDHLMECLGIDANKTVGFSLHVRLDEAVRVTVDEYVDQVVGPPAVCKRRYHLVPVKDAPAPADTEEDDNIGDC